MLALTLGVLTHLVFASAILAMIVAMGFGLSRSLGTVPWPWAALANAVLIAQFPLVHSAMLSAPGRRLLGRLIPGPHGRSLATTTYALIASLQLLALFALWTPSGIVWWQAEGWALAASLTLYAAAWVLLLRSILDAGVELQIGALGWMSVLQDIPVRFPAMPTGGLLRVMRQPIYVAFALTLWTVPTWTPDQLVLAIAFTAYCVAAPILKERRFLAIHGERFEAYQRRVPYMNPFGRR